MVQALCETTAVEPEPTSKDDEPMTRKDYSGKGTR